MSYTCHWCRVYKAHITLRPCDKVSKELQFVSYLNTQIWLKNSELLFTCPLRVRCVKSVQIRSFFWSVFSRIRTEYGKIRSIHSECGKIQNRKNCVFGQFSRSSLFMNYLYNSFHIFILASNKMQSLFSNKIF